jgi:hypothetical protein
MKGFFLGGGRGEAEMYCETKLIMDRGKYTNTQE